MTHGSNALAVSPVHADAMERLDRCNVCGNDRIQQVDPEFHFCRCDSCGHIFDSPRPSGDAVAAFYSQAGKYDSWLEEEQARDALWKRRLKKILPYRVSGNLLDIGAGTGQFLHHARPFFTAIEGTEVSASAITIAKEKYGIELHAGQVASLDLPLCAFDNLTVFHVLEHVPDAAGLLARCERLLRPGGMIFIAVPNDVLAWSSALKRLGKKMDLARFQKFSPILGIARAGTSREIHLSHFTPTVLRSLTECAGLRVLEESLDPYYVSSGLCSLAHRFYFGFHQMLFEIRKINGYETIWMVAQKP